MSLKDQITEDMKAAMRAKDSERLGAIRLLQAAIKQREVDERITLDDAAVVTVVDKLVKQRKDSIAAYEQAARQDLADKEKPRWPCCRRICRRAWMQLKLLLPFRGLLQHSKPTMAAGRRRPTWASSWPPPRRNWRARPIWARYPLLSRQCWRDRHFCRKGSARIGRVGLGP